MSKSIRIFGKAVNCCPHPASLTNVYHLQNTHPPPPPPTHCYWVLRGRPTVQTSKCKFPCQIPDGYYFRIITATHRYRQGQRCLSRTIVFNWKRNNVNYCWRTGSNASRDISLKLQKWANPARLRPRPLDWTEAVDTDFLSNLGVFTVFS